MGFHRIQQGHHYAVKCGMRVRSINVLTFHSGQHFSPLKVRSSAEMHVGGSLLSWWCQCRIAVPTDATSLPVPLVSY